MLQTWSLIERNPSGFINQVGVFLIKPCGSRWRGFTCPKSGRFSIELSEVSHGLGNIFTSNDGLTSSFYTQDMGLLCEFWLLEKNGAMGFEGDILRLKYDVVP